MKRNLSYKTMSYINLNILQNLFSHKDNAIHKLQTTDMIINEAKFWLRCRLSIISKHIKKLQVKSEILRSY